MAKRCLEITPNFILSQNGSHPKHQFPDGHVNKDSYQNMAIPAELSARAATASMIASCFTLTDMPVMANPCSRENGLEIVEMAAIAWGGEAAIKKAPVTIVSVNPHSPLCYTEEAAGGLITFARHGQALLISSMVLAGISGPITIAGTAVMEMTESLAGIVLA